MSSSGGPRAWSTALHLDQGFRTGFTEHTLKRAVSAVLIALLLLSQGYTSALADSGPPWVGATLDDLSYTEREGWKRLDTSVTVFSNTNDFTDGYVEVATSGGTSYDQLRLVSGGSLSVSGTAVNWDGDRIGTIDNTYNGSNGRLRINFSAVAPLPNSGFENGLTGWTANTSFPGLPGDTGAPWSQYATVVSYVPTYGVYEGSYALELRISGTTAACGTAHGPEIVSSCFTGSAGDSLSLHWYAKDSGDDYDVYGYVENTANGEEQLLFYQRGDNTGGWITTNAVIASSVCPSGNCSSLRFRFLCGSQDATCGTVVGSTLYIDGIDLQISGTIVANDNIVSSVVENIEYQNTSYNPATTREYDLNFRESSGSTGFNAAQISITLINEPPTISGTPALSVDEGSPYSFTPTASDPNDDPLTFDIENRPSWASFSTSTGALTGTPGGADAGGYPNIIIGVSDGNGGSDSLPAFTITVHDVNHPPEAANDTATVNEDSPDNAINVLGNDSDPDSDPLTITEVTDPPHGAASIVSNQIRYTPDANYPNPNDSGSDSFTYSISDGKGGTDTATVSVTVNNVNDAPVAANNTATVNEDSSDNVMDVLANDSDADGDALTVQSVTDPPHGTAVLSANKVEYTPDAGYPNPNDSGPDSFSYTVIDGNGGSDTATVNVTVNNVNDAPVAAGDSATVDEDSADNIIDVLANDSDADGDALTLQSVTDPLHGTAIISANKVEYTPDPAYPNPNDTGPDSFSYTVIDGNGGSDATTVNVTVNNVNDPPAASGDVAAVDEDTADNVIDVLANDSDADGDALTLQSITDPPHGTAVISANKVEYTPDAGYPNPNDTGPDSFSYTMIDGHGGSDTATVNVTVDNVNDAPVAAGDSATVDEDSADNVIDVLANDSDADGDALTLQSVTDPLHGTAIISANKVEYTPDPDYPNPNDTGPDSFSYTVIDGNGGSDTATVNVTVNNVNDPPVAVANAATVNEDSSDNVIDVLANDNDGDGDALTIQSVTDPPHGTAIISANKVEYTPDPDYPNPNDTGPDSFSYTVIDGHGGSDTATVNVTVNNVNDPPVAVANAATVNEDSSDNIIDVLANDSDADGDALTVQSVTDPPHGTAIISANKVEYTPDPDYPNPNDTGPGSFSYTVIDGNGGSDTATVNVTVNNVNDAPLAVDDSAVTGAGIPAVVPVLANDSDADEDALSVVGIADPAHGSAVINASNSVTYSPDPEFRGFDAFTYSIDDGNGGVDEGHVTLKVEGGDIVGWVLMDLNGNGTRDYGETEGIGGVMLTLQKPDGEELLLLTQESGWFAFMNLPPGEYAIVEEQPAGYVSTSPDSVVVEVLHDTSRMVVFGEQAEPSPTSTPTCTPTPPPTEEPTPTPSATPMPISRLSGRVTSQSDAPLGGIRVEAYRENGATWEACGSATTSASGQYALTLEPGIHRVHFLDLSGACADEYYDDASDFADASNLSIAEGQSVSGVDASLAPSAEPSVSVSGSVGVWTDPGTGNVQVSAWSRSDMTVVRTVTCHDGSPPTDVSLLVGPRTFAMAQTSPGGSEYSVELRVPEDLPEEGTFELDLRYSCDGETQDEVLGSVHVCLYDPSGQITDASTGEPVKGATVILYLVPSWRPRSGPDDKAPNTCECVNSKDPNEPWSQAAPTRLGILANPDVDLFNQNAIIEPAMNPQVTGADGRYSWNVSEGCWYVLVEAQGYLPAESNVVGVPPAVVDLDITLHRPRIHLPLLVKSV